MIILENQILSPLSLDLKRPLLEIYLLTWGISFKNQTRKLMGQPLKAIP